MVMPMQNMSRQFKLGLIVNPFAGIGGALALKGSDGAEIRNKALANGGEQLAMIKTNLALLECMEYANDICVYTGSDDMGESIAKNLGLKTKVIHRNSGQTEMQDTITLAKQLLAQNVDLILFAGGDGTARNVCSIVNTQLPVLGVPAGCKIHSGVYAISPKAAGKVLLKVVKGELLSLHEAEVRDIDEALFREGKVVSKHYGEMKVPSELAYIQAVKMGGKESDELLLDDISDYVIEIMEEHPDTIFVMGSGSTVDAIMHRTNLPNTLLGVDIVKGGKILGQDLTAAELLRLTENKPTKLIATVIGGQGHIFGRGNQQLSPRFLRNIGKSNILLVATKAKLEVLGEKGLISDSGDASLDTELAGPIQVITGYRDHVLYFVRAS
jgi:predicted polyphosphate/ATP-dependent NAD kinase